MLDRKPRIKDKIAGVCRFVKLQISEISEFSSEKVGSSIAPNYHVMVN